MLDPGERGTSYCKIDAPLTRQHRSGASIKYRTHELTVMLRTHYNLAIEPERLQYPQNALAARLPWRAKLPSGSRLLNRQW